MTWHTEVVDADHLMALLASIRSTGGIVTRSCPCTVGFLVTYVILAS